MSCNSNPYVDWLGIPKTVTRPNYYQLLDLSDFEDNEKKIKGAYYRRVAQVSVYQSGANADTCQLILVELAEARDCLTDAEARTAYAARIARKNRVEPKKKRRHQQPAKTRASEAPSNTKAASFAAARSVKSEVTGSSGSSASSEARQHLKSAGKPTSMVLRRVASEAQLAQLRASSSQSPFDMFSPVKSPGEIVAGLATTRGLTPLQAKLASENDPEELVVGPFILEQELHEGTWGRVYLATRMTTGELVTLRWLPETFKVELSAIGRLIDRIKQISARHHQSPIECGVAQNRPYIVSEYISGEDLWTLVRRSGPLSPQQAIYCVGRIVEALSAAEKLGLKHAELRPSKVLVNRAGEIHLRDLALANVVSERKRRDPNLSKLIQVLPSEHLHFMAPELLLNADAVSMQSDVYSVGCILYFLLTGHCILDGEDPLHIAMERRESIARKRLSAFESLPASLGNCLLRMLAKRPVDRFDNYARIHQTLKETYRALGTSESSSRNQDLWHHVEEVALPDERPPLGIRRVHVGRSLISAATAASLLAVLAAGGIYLMQPPSPEPIVSPVPKPAEREQGPVIVRDQSVDVPVVQAHEVFTIR